MSGHVRRAGDGDGEPVINKNYEKIYRPSVNFNQAKALQSAKLTAK
jgi:hypothetical protein